MFELLVDIFCNIINLNSFQPYFVRKYFNWPYFILPYFIWPLILIIRPYFFRPFCRAKRKYSVIFCFHLPFVNVSDKSLRREKKKAYLFHVFLTSNERRVKKSFFGLRNSTQSYKNCFQFLLLRLWVCYLYKQFSNEWTSLWTSLLTAKKRKNSFLA